MTSSKKYVELAGAERLCDADIERSDLRYALIHHDHAGEERGIKQDHELGDLVDAEIDDHERYQRNRGQGPKKIDHWVCKGSRRPIPAEQEADGNGNENSERDTKENSPCGSIDVVQQAFMQQKFDELRRDLVRGR